MVNEFERIEREEAKTAARETYVAMGIKLYDGCGIGWSETASYVEVKYPAIYAARNTVFAIHEKIGRALNHVNEVMGKMWDKTRQKWVPIDYPALRAMLEPLVAEFRAADVV